MATTLRGHRAPHAGSRSARPRDGTTGGCGSATSTATACSPSATTASGSSTPSTVQPSGLGWSRRRHAARRLDDRPASPRVRPPTAPRRSTPTSRRVCGYWANDMVVAPQTARPTWANFGFDLDTWITEQAARPTGRHARRRRRRHLVVVLAADGAASAVVGRHGVPERHGAHRRRRTLIVAETLGERLTAFDVAADGTLPGGASSPSSTASSPTASASTPRARSGWRTRSRPSASASPRAARSPRASTTQPDVLRVHARRRGPPHAVRAPPARAVDGASSRASTSRRTVP